MSKFTDLVRESVIKNWMVGLSGFYYWKLLDWDMEGKLDLI